MEICRYLAMTRWEMEKYTLPQGFFPAFLSWEADWTDLPETVAPGSLLIVNDRLPPTNPARLGAAAEAFAGVLLDFQKPGQETLVQALAAVLPYPPAVSEPYGAASGGPVFLPPCPPDKPLADHLAPWKNREIWLDTMPEVLTLTLTEAGCTAAPLPQPPTGPHFTDENLCCRYKIETAPNQITFTLWRDKQMLEAHMEQAQALGVTKTFTLFQEWRMLP